MECRGPAEAGAGRLDSRRRELQHYLNSKNVDAAWDFLTWTQEPENLKTYLSEAGKLPSRADLAEDPHWTGDPVLAVFIEQLKVAKPRAYGEHYPEISNAIQEAMQAAISGQSDVAVGADEGPDDDHTAAPAVLGLVPLPRASEELSAMVERHESVPTPKTASAAHRVRRAVRWRNARRLSVSAAGGDLYQCDDALSGRLQHPDEPGGRQRPHVPLGQRALHRPRQLPEVIHDPAFRHAIGNLPHLHRWLAALSVHARVRARPLLQPALSRATACCGALFLLGWMLPTVVSGSVFRWMLDGDFGVVNYALRELSVIDGSHYWLVDPDTALAGTILANIWVGIPFNMVLLLAGLQSIPQTLYEAASCRWRQRMAALPLTDAAADAPGLA